VRFQAFGPPIAEWALCLRVHATEVRPLDAMTEMFTASATVKDSLTTEDTPTGMLAALKAAIVRGDNIALVGRPGAGKTTLLNSILQEAARLRPTARLVTLEDRRELRASHSDTLQLYARVEQANHDGTHCEYGFTDLLSDALRTSFDLLSFGELRDGESAVALLMALNCGTSGLSFTLHADSAFDALGRLEDLIHLAKAPVIRRTIARFVNIIVYLEMDDNKQRRIAGMIRVIGVNDQDDYIIERIEG
jgi:Flp pilus assembly CpaF family ATPase